jgi:hypothetical protein
LDINIKIIIIYEGVSKIFRTDAVKTIKLIIRPIGRNHPRISSLPHVDTGPTVSYIFVTLPGSSFLSECQALSAIRPGSPQWYQTGVLSAFSFIFGNRKKSEGAKSGEYSGWGMTAIFCFARNCWVRTDTGRCHGEAARSVLAKVRGDVFARLHAVAENVAVWNPEFTVWPVWTGASRYHNCCIDGGTSPEYFGYHLICKI